MLWAFIFEELRIFIQISLLKRQMLLDLFDYIYLLDRAVAVNHKWYLNSSNLCSNWIIWFSQFNKYLLISILPIRIILLEIFVEYFRMKTKLK